MGIRLFPKPGDAIEKTSSLVTVLLVKSQRMSMRLCQCLRLAIATSSSSLSADMLDLPLFYTCANPDNVLSPSHSHCRAIADEPVVLYSRLSGDRSGFVRHSGSDRAGTSLCIEPDTPDLSQETVFPGCLPLPEGFENILASIADDPDHHQTVWTLPVSKKVLSVNTTISEISEETSVLLLPCDQEPCVARDYGDRVNVLDLEEMILPGKSGTAERENRNIREVVQTRDQNGNIIYQWYDQDGYLHTISEWEYKRRLSMYFQSWLEFLYPEYFGSTTPAGGGWHQWQYWKVRRTADRPENTGPQQWPARQARHRPSQEVTALSPQVQNHQNDFTSQGTSNLLCSLAKPVKIKYNSKDMTSMPNELVVKILSNLGTRDISVCSRVNNTWKKLIDDLHLQARSFYRDCPPAAGLYSPQKSVERYHSSIRGWLTGFSDKGKKSVEQLDQSLMDKYFPEVLFFSIAKVLAQAKAFLCQNTRTIQQTDGMEIRFIPENNLVPASGDRTTEIRMVVDGQLQEKATIQHAGRVDKVSFSPDGYHLVTASRYGIAKIWSLVDGQWQEKASIQHTNWVNNAIFTYDGNYLVTISDDNTAKIWRFVDEQWQEKATIPHTDKVRSASFSPDGNYLVTASSYGIARIWGPVGGQWQEKATIQHTVRVTNTSFSPDGNHLVTVSYDFTAQIRELVNGQWQKKNTIHNIDWFKSPIFSPDGNHLVVITFGDTVKILGLVAGEWQEKATIQHNEWVYSAIFSPDGNHLATAANDDTAQIWGLVDGQWQKKATIQHTRVTSASFSPDGYHLVTVSDKNIKIWILENKTNDDARTCTNSTSGQSGCHPEEIGL